MINKNIKRMLLFVTLCILLMGIVCAEDVESDDSAIPTDTISDQTTDTIETVSEVNDNAVDNNIEELKKDEKTEKPIKTATKTQTKVSIDYVPNVPVNDYILIMGTLSDVYNNPLKYYSVKLDVNGEGYDTETDYYGDYYGEYYTSLPGTNTITVSYAGNSYYEPTSAKRTFTVSGQASTYIDLYSISDTTVGNNIKINGYYYYGYGTPLTLTTMRLNINGQSYTAKTDNNGYFTYNYKTTKTGTNTVTVSYPGNTRFKAASATETFNVKSNGPQYTYITLNNLPDVAYTGYTTISGYYYYGNNIPLTYTNMRLNINGQSYTAKTDNKGYFTYSYKTNRVGKNTVTVSYPGNTNFKSATATKTFNVKITSPIYTYITLNNVKEVSNGQYTTISGYYYYSNNIPLTSTTMRININGQTYTSKTDNNGYFTYNYKTSKDGSNTVTVSYPGNTNFKSASSTKTFNVKSVGPQYTYITLNNMADVSYGNRVLISGYYYYGNNIPLTYTPMRININGEFYDTVKTDNKGYFEYDINAYKVFKNTVTVSYPGNTNFKAATATKTFNVKITSPIYTYMGVYANDVVKLGDYITIDGYYWYGDGYYPLTQTNINLNINGQKYTVKTDNDGYFKYTFKTTKSGFNKVTASYSGNTNFRGDSDWVTFNVYENKLTFDIIPLTNGIGNRVYRSNDMFQTWYQTYFAQHDKGVFVENFAQDMQDLGDAPYNLMLDATFYFKSSDGNIYTDTFEEGHAGSLYHSLVSGYTPYKVDVYYRKMSQYERNLYEYGYGYDFSTGEWYY